MEASNIFNLKIVTFAGISDFTEATVYGLNNVINKSGKIKKTTISLYYFQSTGYDLILSANTTLTANTYLSQRQDKKILLSDQFYNPNLSLDFKINNKNIFLNSSVRLFDVNNLNNDLTLDINEKIQNMSFKLNDFLISTYNSGALYRYKYILSLFIEVE